MTVINNTWKNVKLRIYNVQADDIDTLLFDSISKADFIEKLKAQEINLPAVEKGEELDIVYELEGDDEEYFITLVNKTSDMESEWYEHRTDEPIVIASVEREDNLVPDYNDERIAAEEIGEEYTQQNYIDMYDEENEPCISNGDGGDSDGGDGED